MKKIITIVFAVAAFLAAENMMNAANALELSTCALTVFSKDVFGTEETSKKQSGIYSRRISAVSYNGDRIRLFEDRRIPVPLPSPKNNDQERVI